jgi:hypothetical protein
MQQFALTGETIMRREDGTLEFVGQPGDPREDAVKRMAEAASEGRMPSDADMAMVEDIPIIDEVAIANAILIIHH